MLASTDFSASTLYRFCRFSVGVALVLLLAEPADHAAAGWVQFQNSTPPADPKAPEYCERELEAWPAGSLTGKPFVADVLVVDLQRWPSDKKERGQLLSKHPGWRLTPDKKYLTSSMISGQVARDSAGRVVFKNEVFTDICDTVARKAVQQNADGTYSAWQGSLIFPYPGPVYWPHGGPHSPWKQKDLGYMDTKEFSKELPSVRAHCYKSWYSPTQNWVDQAYQEECVSEDLQTDIFKQNMRRWPDGELGEDMLVNIRYKEPPRSWFHYPKKLAKNPPIVPGSGAQPAQHPQTPATQPVQAPPRTSSR